MAKQAGTRLNIQHCSEIDLEDISKFPGVKINDSDDNRHERIRYTIGTRDTRIISTKEAEFPKIYYRDLRLAKISILDGVTKLVIEPNGYFDKLLERKTEFVEDKLKKGIAYSLFDTMRDFTEHYIKDRAKVKKEYREEITEAIDNGINISEKTKMIEDEYNKNVDDINEKLNKFKSGLKEKIPD